MVEAVAEAAVEVEAKAETEDCANLFLEKKFISNAEKQFTN